MAQATYVKIASTTVTSTVTKITFSSIPSTYLDLHLYVNARFTTNLSNGYAYGMGLNFNGDSNSAVYKFQRILGATTNTTAADQSSAYLIGTAQGAATTADAFAYYSIYIPNYTNTSIQRNAMSNYSTVNSAQDCEWGQVHLNYNATAACTSLDVFVYATTATYANYTTAILYGIQPV